MNTNPHERLRAALEGVERTNRNHGDAMRMHRRLLWLTGIMILLMLVSRSWLNAASLMVFFITVWSFSKTDKLLWLSVRESYLHNADFWRKVIKMSKENQ